MPSLPTGTVTFLFTDIEASTQLLRRLGDSAYAHVLTDHRRLLRTAFETGRGHEIETQGDGFLVAFQSARDAILAALAAQRAITAHPWPDGVALRIRMGLDTAETTIRGDAYAGLGIHRAARICSSGWGGQILLSRTTADVLENDLPEGMSLRDLGDHRLKDLQRPEKVFHLLHPDLPTDFPPLRSLDRMPNNLPRQLTSFIGREREMADVKRRLSTTRLLTLTGSGGCGKTRLALQVAADLAEAFADGVWLVELAPLSDPALVAQTVASTLNVREQPGRPILATLSESLQPRHLLLVLDNCEHLVAACAQMADALLRACPHLKILATSREPLRIAGEVTWRVPSLSLPELLRLPSLKSLTEYEAVRLFIDRAAAVVPDFLVTDQNAPAVAQVCHRLDGIPLAIELAAARVKVLAVEQIALRLDDRFRLLTGGGRSTLPRQQTLRAAMDWSHVLLSETERTLLRRVSVFTGGCSLQAAEAICAGRGIEEDEVLDLLSQLVDKSLIVVDMEGAEARYRLLDTVRQYAREKLLDAGEETDLRGRHREWFLDLAERAEPELRGPAQSVWLERLELEHDNLRAAVEWSQTEKGTGEVGLRLAAALGRFWWMRGHFAEGRGWLEGLLRESSDALPAPRARALLEAGRLAWAQSDYAAAGALCEESLALSRELSDQQGISDALNSLGLVAWTQGDYAAARARYEEGLILSRDLGDSRRIAVLLNNLGLVAGTQGEYAVARSLHEESLGIRRDLGDTHGSAYSLNNLGLVAAAEGDHAAARALFEESVQIRRGLGDKLGLSNSLHSLGLVAHHQGDDERAVALCQESLALSRELGERQEGADALSTLGRVAHHRGNYGQAVALCRESLAMRRELGDKRGIPECLERLAAVACAQGGMVRAAQLFGAAEALREAMGVPLAPSDRAWHDRNVTALRTSIGKQALTKAWAEGLAMTLGKSVELAMTEAE